MAFGYKARGMEAWPEGDRVLAVNRHVEGVMPAAPVGKSPLLFLTCSCV